MCLSGEQRGLQAAGETLVTVVSEVDEMAMGERQETQCKPTLILDCNKEKEAFI